MKNILRQELQEYKKFNKEDIIISIYHRITKHPNYIINRAIICAKKYKYYKTYHNSLLNKIKMIYYGRKNNRYAMRYNIEIYGKFGKCLKVYHNNIVINDKAIIGNNVVLHGNNCIGNNGTDEKCPIIGNNVDIGYGAILIGEITIADNIKIGANSVVTKSFFEEGIVIAGVPAKSEAKRS